MITRSRNESSTPVELSTPPESPLSGSYEQLVAQKRQRNQERMQSLGLIEAARALKKRKKKTLHKSDMFPTSARQSSRRPSTSTRRSSRKAGKPRQYEPTLDDLDQILLRRKKFPVLLRRKKCPPVLPLTEEQRSTLRRAEEDWIEGMHTFLLRVPHGNHSKTVSEANARSVMRQVRLLAAGAGVAYHHWPDTVKFCESVPIDLSSDLQALYDEAQGYEDKYGKDLGNGWLLRHPIAKMMNYQQYKFEKQKD